jgi:hypothetical protein
VQRTVGDGIPDSVVMVLLWTMTEYWIVGHLSALHIVQVVLQPLRYLKHGNDRAASEPNFSRANFVLK